MIANVVRGRGFRGLLDYLFQTEKFPEVVAGNMAGLTARDLAREFAGARNANDRVKTPVFHCSLSLPIDERLDRGKWAVGAERFLGELGLAENRPWVAIRHRDKDHDHIHIVTSRTDYLGEVWYGAWEVKKVLNAKAVVEQELGLTVTPYRQPERRISKALLRQAERLIEQGTDDVTLPALSIQRAIDAAMASSGGNHDGLAAELEKHGVTVKFNQSKTTGRVSGAAFSADNGRSWSKGSQLGKAYRWTELSARLDAAKESHPKNETIRTEIHVNEPTQHRGAAGSTSGQPATNPEGYRIEAAFDNRCRDIGNAEGTIPFPDFSARAIGSDGGSASAPSRRIEPYLARAEQNPAIGPEPTTALGVTILTATKTVLALLRRLRAGVDAIGPFLDREYQHKLDAPDLRWPTI